MSKIRYLLPITAGAPNYLINSLQLKQNEVMRIILDKKWQPCGKKLVSTADLLNGCKWLSIHQLGVLTSTSQLHNIILRKEPRQLYDKLTTVNQPRTRNMVLRKYPKPNITIPNYSNTWKSWRWRAVCEYNCC